MPQTELMPRPAGTPLEPPRGADGSTATMAGATATGDDQVILNRYRVMSTNDTGGFGQVAVCWDTRLQRRVAIKRIPLGTGDQPAHPGATPGWADTRAPGGSPRAGAPSILRAARTLLRAQPVPEQPPATTTVAAALSEARTACLLSHPHIVSVHDFEVEGSYAYLVMEYIDGLSLAELLSRVEYGVLTYDETAYLVQSVAEALAHAHENGVLHLDIKPSNILVDRSGEVKICDFGMAQLASAAGYADARGGTVGYMPPEQIVGEAVDERADVFSFAVVVWQALLGASPFAADTADASLALIEKGPEPPTKQDPDLAGPAEDALLVALSAIAAGRMSSVGVLADELLAGLGDPQAGRRSLRGLVSQDEQDEALDPQEWEGERLPISIAYPWVAPLVTRLLAAIVTGASVFQLLEATPARQFLPTTLAQLPAPLLATIPALLAALWPPLGSATTAAGFVATAGLLATRPVSFAITAAIALVLLGWWLRCGTQSWLSTPSFVAPLCLHAPIAGVPVAAYAYAGSPLIAGLSATLSWLFARVWLILVPVAFRPDATIAELFAPFLYPSSLVALVGVGLSAALAARITGVRATTGRTIVGQLLCCVVLVFSQLTSQRMENGGIWPQPSWATTGVAVLLCMLVCTASVLYGPREEHGE